jgi:anti-sigma factor RsiW
MPEDTVIAGISCSQVLAHLSDFVDGVLPAEKVEALEAHLAECEHCARFGAEFTETLGQLKDQLVPEGGSGGELAGDIAARLEARLNADSLER